MERDQCNRKRGPARAEGAAAQVLSPEVEGTRTRMVPTIQQQKTWHGSRAVRESRDFHVLGGERILSQASHCNMPAMFHCSKWPAPPQGKIIGAEAEPLSSPLLHPPTGSCRSRVGFATLHHLPSAWRMPKAINWVQGNRSPSAPHLHLALSPDLRGPLQTAAKWALLLQRCICNGRCFSL